MTNRPVLRDGFIEFRIAPFIATQLDAEAVRVRAQQCHADRLTYEYREEHGSGAIRCERRFVEILASVLVDLGETAVDRETRVGAMRAAKAALDAVYG